MGHIILFDGVCNFCNSSVQFIIKRDKKGNYQFASLQGEYGSQLLRRHGIGNNLNSIVLIEDDKYYVKSTAALRICRHLSWPYKLLSVLMVVPAPVRNLFYDIIAKNRYKWFGKSDSCMLPSPEVRSRFLD